MIWDSTTGKAALMLMAICSELMSHATHLASFPGHFQAFRGDNVQKFVRAKNWKKPLCLRSFAFTIREHNKTGEK